MSERRALELDDVPALAPRIRLQWEPAQNTHVLLYPEGMIKLSDTAAEILKRIDGAATIAQVIAALERYYSDPDSPRADLRADVLEFLAIAYERGWIAITGRD
jgi:pyrroloquinoline quinone biosynthesis protein D